MNILKKFSAAFLSAVMLASACPAFASAAPAPTATPEATVEPTHKPTMEELEKSLEARNINGIEVSDDFINYRVIAGYISELFIDDTLSVDDIMLKGISKYLEDHDEALDEMLKSMFSSLDPYSEFMTAAEYSNFENSVNNTFYGIGVSLRQNGEYVEIVGFVEENSLAEQTGFMVGDKFVKVGGVDVVGWSLEDIRNKIIGEVNTTVNITVLRGNEYIDLVGTRTEVRQETVTSAVFEKNIGYIKITSFGANTAAEFDAALSKMNDRGVSKIILDLRDNGGGRLDAAVKIAEMVVPEGRIVEVRYRNPEYDVIYNSKLKKTNKQLIVLVNENTASASEILASAIQDSGAGRLLGTQTYGKAVVQQTFQLGQVNRDPVFKLTVAEYITRNGNHINNEGLQPDIFIINDWQPLDSTQYTKFDFRTKWSVGSSGTGVRAAKERLAMLGYYSGNTENEDFYKDLQSAVKTFQLDMGLVPYGVIDIPTQVKLENRFESIRVVTDKQIEEAYKEFGGNIEDLYSDETEE